MRAIHSRAPTFLHDDVAGNLEDEIGPIECAQREPVGGGGHLEVVTHGQRGEADVDPINIGEEVAENRKWQQAHVDFPHGRLFNSLVHSFPPLFWPRLKRKNIEAPQPALLGHTATSAVALACRLRPRRLNLVSASLAFNRCGRRPDIRPGWRVAVRPLTNVLGRM